MENATAKATRSLLALGLVAGLGSGFDGLPPGTVLGVPCDGLVQPLREVRVPGLPAQLAAELGAVDGVAAVVAGAVAHPVEVVRGPAHAREYRAQHVDVGLLAVGADEVGLAHLAAGEDGPHGARVVVGVDPVAHVAAVAVELGANAVQDIGDLARDELLHVLVGAVVVGAVANGGAGAERAVPGAHQVVGGRLGGAVGGAGAVWGLLGEARRVVQREVAVDLVGGDVVVAHAELARGLQQAEGALDVGAQERSGVVDGVVVVALGGVVHDCVVAGHEAVQQPGVADVAHNELHAVGGQPRDILAVAGVGELVENRDVDPRVIGHDVVNEVGPDEATAARDDNVLELYAFGEFFVHFLSACSSTS